MKVLNVGCGMAAIHSQFTGWDEVRLDIDPEVEPDICCDMLEMLRHIGVRNGKATND